MRQIITKFSLIICNNIKKSNFLITLFKRLIKCRRLVINFNGFKIEGSNSSVIESNIIFNNFNK